MITIEKAIEDQLRVDYNFLGDIGEPDNGLSQKQEECKEKFGVYNAEKISCIMYLIEDASDGNVRILPRYHNLDGLRAGSFPFGFYKVWYACDGSQVYLDRLYNVDPSHDKYLKAYNKVLQRAINDGHIVKNKNGTLERSKDKGIYRLNNGEQFKVLVPNGKVWKNAAN